MRIKSAKVGLRVRPAEHIRQFFNNSPRLNWTGTIIQVGLVPTRGTVRQSDLSNIAELVVVSLDRIMTDPDGFETATVVYHPSNLERIP